MRYQFGLTGSAVTPHEHGTCSVLPGRTQVGEGTITAGSDTVLVVGTGIGLMFGDGTMTVGVGRATVCATGVAVGFLVVRADDAFTFRGATGAIFGRTVASPVGYIGAPVLPSRSGVSGG